MSHENGKKFKRCVIFFTSLCLFWAAGAPAETVVLKNGDRISGTIKRINTAEQYVLMETFYGAYRIRTAHVREVEDQPADRRLRVFLKEPGAVEDTLPALESHPEPEGPLDTISATGVKLKNNARVFRWEQIDRIEITYAAPAGREAIDARIRQIDAEMSRLTLERKKLLTARKKMPES